MHRFLTILSLFIWVPFIILGIALIAISIYGHKKWPDTNKGNCWTFALPRWWLNGGSLVVVPTEIKIAGVPVPHLSWMPEGPLYGVVQTEPNNRISKDSSIWVKIKNVVYFDYHIVNDDLLHRRHLWRKRSK